MALDNLKIDDIYLAALEKAEGEERGAYLDEACGSDSALRARVDRLLSVQPEVGSFLESPAPGINVSPTLDQSITEQPGAQIGPYKLLQPIGEGGMGVVYMAEQKEPVKRRVALKIIKPGMDTRQVIARFEAERQALAMMDHPNIAKVLDAGATDSGRPYFVMELVNGLPVTKYCDERHLTPKERLELYVHICQAVQHAHQKGVIHRDLKPGNILVGLYDGRPVPKIIDFGVAKATSQALTEKTMFTQLGQVVGTLEYMSPEQAERNQLDIDTRSDIYSLGVVLYELLTGCTPFDAERFRSAAFGDMLQVIRLEEPPRPSTKLSASDTLPTIAANRRIDPRKLASLLRGELDWIVMKALEKERARRYQTSAAFAEDVQRYLRGETVLACPPSMAYRLKKYVQRRKAALSVAVVIAVLVMSLGSAVGWVWRDRVAQEEEKARQQIARQSELAARVDLIASEARRLMGQRDWTQALAAAQRAETLLGSPDVNQDMRTRVKSILDDLSFVRRLEQARECATTWSGMSFDDAGAAEAYAAAFRDYGIDLLAVPKAEALKRLRARDHLVATLASALDDWAGRLVQIRNRDHAERLINLADALDPHPWRSRVRLALLHLGGDEVRDDSLLKLAAEAPVEEVAPSSFWQLAAELRHRGQLDAAKSLLQRAQAAHPSDFWVNYDLASYCDDQGEAALEALMYCRVALAIRPRHPATLSLLGSALRNVGRHEEAIQYHRRAIELDSKFAPAWHNLGLVLLDLERMDEAIESFRQAKRLAPEHPLPHAYLGEALRRVRRLDEAIQAFNDSLERDPDNSTTHNNFGIALMDADRWQEALEHLQRATEIDPRYAIAYNNLGNAQKLGRRFEAAAAAYREAIQLDPSFAAAHYNLGLALMELGRLEEAAESWRQAISINPQSDQTECCQAYFNLGIYLAKNQDVEGAMDCWRKGLELNPNEVRAKGYLVRELVARARLLADAGALEEARDACREALGYTAHQPQEPLRQLHSEAEQLLKMIAEAEGQKPGSQRKAMNRPPDAT